MPSFDIIASKPVGFEFRTSGSEAHRRIDKPRGNRVDQNIPIRKFKRRTPAILADGRFGGCIRRCHFFRPFRMNGSHMNDSAAIAHERNNRSGHQNRPVQQCVKRRPPCGKVCSDNRFGSDNAGTVHQCIHRGNSGTVQALNQFSGGLFP